MPSRPTVHGWEFEHIRECLGAWRQPPRSPSSLKSLWESNLSHAPSWGSHSWVNLMNLGQPDGSLSESGIGTAESSWKRCCLWDERARCVELDQEQSFLLSERLEILSIVLLLLVFDSSEHEFGSYRKRFARKDGRSFSTKLWHSLGILTKAITKRRGPFSTSVAWCES